MHRIDSNGNVNGLFSNGNPQAGQLATRFTAEWCNDIQENLLHVIEQAGFDPEKGAYHQLYLAIVTLIAGAGGEGEEETDVPITRLINTSGLLTGGGALAADLNLAVAKATAAEIRAAAIDTKAVTPLELGLAVIKSLGATGYLKRVDGMIEMWGTATALANSTTVVTLPTTFATACVFAACQGGGGEFEENGPTVTGRGTGSISISSALDTNAAVNWFAYGY